MQVVKKQLHALTGLRLLAATWVLLLHFQGEILNVVPGLAFASPFFNSGGSGVDLFFLLSGFILTHQYLDRLGNGFSSLAVLKFLRLRLARVYPVHFVMLNVSLVLFVGAGLAGISINDEGAIHTPWSYVQNLFLVQSWAGQPYSWNGVAWSVSAEWFAYLLFPLFAIALYRARRKWVFFAGIALTLAVSTFVLSPGSEGPADHAGPSQVLIRISTAFIIGCFVQRLYATTDPPKWMRRGAAPIALLLIVASCYVPTAWPGLVILAFALLVYGLAIGEDRISGLLSTRVMVYGGEISYSLYMVHTTVFAICRKFLPLESDEVGPALGILFLGVTFAVAFLSAAAMFHIVEKPCRSLLRGRIVSKETTEAARTPDRA